MKVGLALRKNVIEPSPKSVFIPLELKVALQQKTHINIFWLGNHPIENFKQRKLNN